jgi:iron complex transport system permease protein
MAGRGWPELAMAAPYAALGDVLAFAVAAPLNALRVGELRARAVGPQRRSRAMDHAGRVVALGGEQRRACRTRRFIGLIVPHIGRRIVGSDARVLLPACASLGAALCMFADAVCRRIVAPAELPIGVLLAFIGVPAFLYLYLRPASARAGAVSKSP